MSQLGQKYIKRDDRHKIRDLAVKLNDTYSPKVRMDLQQAFVREMGAKYGQESAALMLTNVWRLAKRLKKDDYV